jgi:hypothetical protein
VSILSDRSIILLTRLARFAIILQQLEPGSEPSLHYRPLLLPSPIVGCARILDAHNSVMPAERLCASARWLLLRVGSHHVASVSAFFRARSCHREFRADHANNTGSEAKVCGGRCFISQTEWASRRQIKRQRISRDMLGAENRVLAGSPYPNQHFSRIPEHRREHTPEHRQENSQEPKREQGRLWRTPSRVSSEQYSRAGRTTQYCSENDRQRRHYVA